MSITVKEVLEKILLPVSAGWHLDAVEVLEPEQEIHVKVSYQDSKICISNEIYEIYDYRKERIWRHLDLWEYKTIIKARIPRYISSDGSIKSSEVPWADGFERMSHLLEKKQ